MALEAYLTKTGFYKGERCNTLFETFVHGLDVAVIDQPRVFATQKALSNLLSIDLLHATKDLVEELFCVGESSPSQTYEPYLGIGKDCFDSIARAILDAEPLIGDDVIVPDNFYLALQRLQYMGEGVHERVENAIRDYLYIPTSGHGHSIHITQHTIGRAFSGSSMFSIVSKYVGDVEENSSLEWQEVLALFESDDQDHMRDIVDTMKTSYMEKPPGKLNETSAFHAFKLFKHDETINHIEKNIEDIQEALEDDTTDPFGSVDVSEETYNSNSGHSSHTSLHDTENSEDYDMSFDKEKDDSSEPATFPEDYEKQYLKDQLLLGDKGTE